MPVGVLYRNADLPCYEDLVNSGKLCTPETVEAVLEKEFDKFTIDPAA
jgi:2-oxoglutarate ferredoxin oxidoreductase subunit beta